MREAIRESMTRMTHEGGGCTPSTLAATKDQWWQLCSRTSYLMRAAMSEAMREVISEAIGEVMSVRARRPFGCHSDQLLVRGGRGEHTAPEEELAAQRQRRPPLLVLVVRHVPNDSGAVAARDVVKGVLDALHRMPGWHITRRVERT